MGKKLRKFKLYAFEIEHEVYCVYRTRNSKEGFFRVRHSSLQLTSKGEKGG